MERIRILIMDDEIFANDGNPSIQAREALEKEGYLVEVTDKMSVVLKGIKNRYFDIYILDIDMTKVHDDLDKATGSSIGRVLRERNSFSKIVIFSARGDLKDWLLAGNYHFQGYIHKGDNGVDKLVKHIKYLESNPRQIKISLEKAVHNNSIMIYFNTNTPKEKITIEEIEKIVKNVLYNPQITIVNKLADVIEKVTESPALIILVHSMFQNEEDTNRRLQKIFSVQPFPHIIVAIDCNDGEGYVSNQPNILNIVNLNPFKIVDINSPVPYEQIEKAVRDSIEWYGEQEIFDYPEDFKDFYGHPLSPEDIETIKKAADYYEDIETDEEYLKSSGDGDGENDV